MRTAVITIAHGRHDHWRNQRLALARQSTLPALHVLVAMQDPRVPVDRCAPALSVLHLHADPSRLPLARARNLGAEAAIDSGAELLIFLDVDCIPSVELVSGYEAAATDPEFRDALLCGPVTYLPASADGTEVIDRLDEWDDPHPARPAPARGEILSGGNPEHFWSLSFAVNADTWRNIGGFSERYLGYGGEDTDFGFLAHRTGVDLAWVGSARAYHQFHAVEDPPVRHLEDIVRNGRVFADRWGFWPMPGWLDRFEEMGLVVRDPYLGYRVCAHVPPQLHPGASSAEGISTAPSFRQGLV